MLYRVHLARGGFKFTTLVVIGTDCTVSCKSNYHTVTTMTAPRNVHYMTLLYALKIARKNLRYDSLKSLLFETTNLIELKCA
jgi:hypothetical protein